MFQSRHWELCTCVSAHTTPQAFKLHFEPGWPSEQTKIGQVGGVATDNDGNVYIFHRGQRVWDATWVHTLLLQLFGLGGGGGGGGWWSTYQECVSIKMSLWSSSTRQLYVLSVCVVGERCIWSVIELWPFPKKQLCSQCLSNDFCNAFIPSTA